ncbi:MAG TPA: hypothetical protein VNA12_05420 [Mycobacteriales bacterium]|nr:hypothetical protein [Mycobacteriales bacterium]
MRRAVLATTVLAGIGALVLPSSAAPPKPITKTYTVTAAPSGIASAYCTNMPTTHEKHYEPFSAPAKGTLKVSMTASAGDWDIFLLDAAGSTIAESASLGLDPESYTYKVKKAQKLSLLTCNPLGGPTATVTYTFTFAA